MTLPLAKTFPQQVAAYQALAKFWSSAAAAKPRTAPTLSARDLVADKLPEVPKVGKPCIVTLQNSVVH